jgi:hypothetical protein
MPLPSRCAKPRQQCIIHAECMYECMYGRSRSSCEGHGIGQVHTTNCLDRDMAVSLWRVDRYLLICLLSFLVGGLDGLSYQDEVDRDKEIVRLPILVYIIA